MKTTQEIQKELMKLLPESKLEVIKAIKKYFPRNSSVYREAVLLKARVNSLKKKELEGVMSIEEVQIEENKIRASLMDLITSIGALKTIEGSQPNRKLLIWVTFILLFVGGIFIGWKYFGDEKPISGGNDPIDSLATGMMIDTMQRNITSNASAPKSPVGRILYSVPNKMQVDKKTPCIIRISRAELSTLKLVEGVPTEAPIELDSIRIGDVMTAKITTAPGDNAFKITSPSTTEQIIEEGFFTEWKFDVTPLEPGIHFLFLKVTVKVKTEDFGVKERDIFVMDKKIEILSEEVEIGEPVMENGGNVMLASLQNPVNIEDEKDKSDQQNEEVEVDKNDDKAALNSEVEENVPKVNDSKPKNNTNTNTTKSTTKSGGLGTNDKGKGAGTNVPIFTVDKDHGVAKVGEGLRARKVTYEPAMRVNPIKTGVVVVKICVDRNGKVISAKLTSKGSTTTDTYLTKNAVANAKKWKFVRSKQDKQCGTLRYDFKLK